MKEREKERKKESKKESKKERERKKVREETYIFCGSEILHPSMNSIVNTRGLVRVQSMFGM